MKKIISLFLITLITTGLFSCKVNEEAKVRKVTKDFLIYLNKQDYENAKKLGTRATGQMLDMMEAFGNLGGSETTSTENLEIEILYCNIKNDSAICGYTTNGKEEKVELVKIKDKWLVDMKKEVPSTEESQQAAYADSVAAVQAAYDDSVYYATYQEDYQPDTMTYFDFCLTDMHNQSTSGSFTFMLNNRSEYDIHHLWVTLYFTDKDGKFIQKKDVMFDNVLKYYIPEGDSVSYGNWQEAAVTLEKVNVDNISEIFIFPFRVNMQTEVYDNMYDGQDLYDIVKNYTNFKNSTGKEVKITF
jgi:hypothetical protein